MFRALVNIWLARVSAGLLSAGEARGIRRTSDGGPAAGLRTLAPDRHNLTSGAITMNRIYCIRRLAGVLVGLAGALVAFAAAAPAALAVRVPPPGGSGGTPPPAPVTVVAGGMPGWLITLIVIGVALLAATLAVLLDRARARRHSVTAAA